MFGRAPLLAGYDMDTVEETTDARLKDYLGMKKIGRYRVKLEVGAFVFMKKEMFECDISRKLETK